MLLSEAIAQLEALYDEHGDVPMVRLADEDGLFALDHDAQFELIMVPNEDESEEHPHVTYMPSYYDEYETVPNLTVIKGEKK